MMEQAKDNFKVSFDFVKTPITQIADYIIIAASKHGTSDIHFDPRENGMMVRFRIDGDLQDYSFIPKAYERNLTTRLKLLANMNITESRLPQDGAIKGMFGDTYLDMRVSCLPLNEGEKIVIRILDYTRSLQGIDSLGFHPNNLIKLKRMMGAPNGIILVTGATGSGKSTTTYSILQGLNTPETNIITVEDPIEMNIQGINQVQVNSEIGMTFAAALRSILRQDPNVILIGEIRDSETAQIAVRSAITGHLVLSTIHTNNSLSTIERLLDMDVERYLLSTALTGIISQRLAKGICPKCRFQRRTTPYEQKIFRNFLKLDVKTIWDANPDGCENCRKGYKGRIAIQEVLELDDEIRGALTIEGLKKEELRKMVYTDKTITMLQDALIKCLNGETNFEEVYRVIEMENDDGDDYTSELTAAINEARDPNASPLPGTTINAENLNIQLGGATTISTDANATTAALPNVVNNLVQATPVTTQVTETVVEAPVAEQPTTTITVPAEVPQVTTAPEVVQTTTEVIPQQPVPEVTTEVQPEIVTEVSEQPVITETGVPEITPLPVTNQAIENTEPQITETVIEETYLVPPEEVQNNEVNIDNNIDNKVTEETQQVDTNVTQEQPEVEEAPVVEEAQPEVPLVSEEAINNANVEVPETVETPVTEVAQPEAPLVSEEAINNANVEVPETVETPVTEEAPAEVPLVSDEAINNANVEVPETVDAPVTEEAQPEVPLVSEEAINNASVEIPTVENTTTQDNPTTEVTEENNDPLSNAIPTIDYNIPLDEEAIKESTIEENNDDITEDVQDTPVELSDEQIVIPNINDLNKEEEQPEQVQVVPDEMIEPENHVDMFDQILNNPEPVAEEPLISDEYDGTLEDGGLSEEITPLENPLDDFYDTSNVINPEEVANTIENKPYGYSDGSETFNDENTTVVSPEDVQSYITDSNEDADKVESTTENTVIDESNNDSQTVYEEPYNYELNNEEVVKNNDNNPIDIPNSDTMMVPEDTYEEDYVEPPITDALDGYVTDDYDGTIREPIGSDSVDVDGQLLEELPRLSTEVEEDTTEDTNNEGIDDTNTYEVPEYVEE